MKKIILLVGGILLLASCQESAGEKTAFVDNTILFKNFDALQSTTQKYEKRMQKLQDEAQVESQNFQQKVQEFQEGMQNMTEKQAEDRQMELIQEQQRLQQDLGQKESSLQDEMGKTQDSLEGILKDKIKSIAKKGNYTYIFGMNENYNILYGDDAKDITDEVIEEINKSIQ